MEKTKNLRSCLKVKLMDFFVGFQIWRLGDKRRKKSRKISRFQDKEPTFRTRH